MIYESVVSEFKKYSGNCSYVHNGTDLFVYPNVSFGIANDFRNNFGLDKDEEILWARDTSFWNNRNQGLVLTDYRMSVICDNEKEEEGRFYVNLQDFKYTKIDNDMVYFLDDNDDIHAQINLSFFFKDSSNYPNLKEFGRLLHKCAKAAKACADDMYTIEDARTDLQESVFADDFDMEKVKEYAEQVLELSQGEYDNMVAYYFLAKAYDRYQAELWNQWIECKDKELKDDLDERQKEANEQVSSMIQSAFSAIETQELMDSWEAELTYWGARAAQRSGNSLNAVRACIKALPKSQSDDETNNLKSIISCLKHGESVIHTGGGYGFTGKSKDAYLKETLDELNSYEGWTEEEVKEVYEMEKEHTGESDGFFSNRPYQDRQFIFTVRNVDSIGGCYDETDNIKYVIPINEMPGDISFPLGHPQPNTLYYAHPLRPYYLPVENAQLQLFYEKVQEICRLFQCLGATEITTRSIKGHRVNESFNASVSMEGEAGYKILGVSGSQNKSTSGNQNTESRNEMSLTQSFSPTKAPYCPDDLLWATKDPEIQTFIKQRLEGGLLTFTKRISTFETMSVSSTQMLDVKAAFHNLIMNVSGNFKAESDRTFNETSETEWELSVVFKPINEFSTSQSIESSKDVPLLESTSGLSAQEQEYLEEVKYVLEDGEISNRERRSLERLAAKLGISSERAALLEKSLSEPSLTEEEKDYLEEYKSMLEDGEIGERERRTLERLRNRLGLSAEKVSELEKTVCPSTYLSEEEQDYLEEYKSMLEDGEIGERERRTLERLRTRNGISAERAKELESL